MVQPVFINATDFLEILKSQGLVIVSVAEFEAGKSIARKQAMKRISLTIKEIVDLQLLPLKTKKGVLDWIASGRIKSDEVIRMSDSKKTIKVLTSAIVRMGYSE